MNDTKRKFLFMERLARKLKNPLLSFLNKHNELSIGDVKRHLNMINDGGKIKRRTFNKKSKQYYEDLRSRIKKLYKEGLTYRQIAVELNVDYSKIEYNVRRLGILPRPGGITTNLSNKSPRELQEIAIKVNKWRTEGRALYYIQNQLKVSYPTLKNFITTHCNEKKMPRKMIDRPDLIAYVRMHCSSMKVIEMAYKLGVSYATVHRILVNIKKEDYNA